MRDLFALQDSQKLLAKAVENLDRENDNLAEEIEKIKRSREYSLKVLKDKYHLTEEGESIIFVPE